jgi:hypothetical protein
MTINAQEQELTDQLRQLIGAITGVTQTQTATTFQSTDDSFRIQVPQGWIIEDVNNTLSVLLEESRLGYAILAQVCPQEEQQMGTLSNNTSSISNSCQGAQEEIVHIIRYPNLSTGIQPVNNITAYHLQKLQEIGYNSIQVVSSTDTSVNITHPQTNETIETVPAKFAEMTYSTASAPNEIGRGYFLLTATDMTSPNLGITKGYSVFYEGNPNNTSTTTSPQIITTSASSGSPPLPLSTGEAQIIDSFELIAAPEAASVIVPSTPTAPNVSTEQTTSSSEVEEEEEEEEASQTGQSECSPSYPDTCIPPPPPNLNCDDVDDTNFEVVGSDPHGFDGDNDGVECESGASIPDDEDDSSDDEGSDEDEGGDSGSGGSDDEGSSRCPNGYHRSPSGDCERVTDTSGMPRCPNGYHRSPDGDCERV